jgi:ribosomal protein S18 acetylase RimI-like enzyme
VAPSLLEIAEAPGAYVTPKHPAVVDGDGWVFVPLAPNFAAVQRVRVPAERLEAARAEVRALAAERDIPEVGWFRSALAEPQDLGPRLGLELGETLTVLALRQAPRAEAAHEIHEVTTFDDFVTALQIDATANGWQAADREACAEMWPASRERFAMWLAHDDGVPVGMGRCAVAGNAFVMIGGSVLPEARGRGVYRSLVAARWAAARARGLDALVTSANNQSGPILERLAFERLGEIDVWSDRI